jgi:hypothetical protein
MLQNDLCDKTLSEGDIKTLLVQTLEKTAALFLTYAIPG